MAPDRDLYAEDVLRMTAHQRHRRGPRAVDPEVYADDLKAMDEHQRRMRARRNRRPGADRGVARYGGEHRGGGFSPWAALAIAGGAMALSGIIGRRYSPAPANPGIDRWYRDLDKPCYTPPDPVFGAVWPVLEVLLAAGGYRLLRSPPGRERDTAIALWLFNVAMIGGWTKIFFGERSLAGGSLAAAGMVGSGAAYVEFARRIDGLAGAAGVPYTAWLAFAALLSEEVWRRNAQ